MGLVVEVEHDKMVGKPDTLDEYFAVVSEVEQQLGSELMDAELADSAEVVGESAELVGVVVVADSVELVVFWMDVEAVAGVLDVFERVSFVPLVVHLQWFDILTVLVVDLMGD